MIYAYIDNGLHSYDVLNSFGFAPVRLHKLGNINIGRCKVLIVPFHTDQLELENNKKRLVSYWKNGGILILMGVMANRIKWIPNTTWHEGQLLLNDEVIEVNNNCDDAKIIFNNIKNEDILNNKIHAHGTFSYPCGKSIVRHKNGNIIMQVDDITCSGRLLITTLDPEHHSDIQTTNEYDYIHKISKILLNNIIDWANHQRKAQSGIKWWVRNVKRGIIGFFYSRQFYLSLTVVSMLIGMYYLIKDKTVFSIMANICSIVGVLSLFKRN